MGPVISKIFNSLLQEHDFSSGLTGPGNTSKQWDLSRRSIQGAIRRNHAKGVILGDNHRNVSGRLSKVAFLGRYSRGLRRVAIQGDYPGGLWKRAISVSFPMGGYPGGLPKDAILEDYLRILFRVCQLTYCFYDGSRMRSDQS